MLEKLVLGWPEIMTIASILVAWTGLQFALMKWLIEWLLDSRFKALETEIKRFHGVERELLELKADLPLRYLQRDDFIRSISALDAKFDRMRALLDELTGGRHRA